MQYVSNPMLVRIISIITSDQVRIMGHPSLTSFVDDSTSILNEVGKEGFAFLRAVFEGKQTGRVAKTVGTTGADPQNQKAQYKVSKGVSSWRKSKENACKTAYV